MIEKEKFKKGTFIIALGVFLIGCAKTSDALYSTEERWSKDYVYKRIEEIKIDDEVTYKEIKKLTEDYAYWKSKELSRVSDESLIDYYNVGKMKIATYDYGFEIDTDYSRTLTDFSKSDRIFKMMFEVPLDEIKLVEIKSGKEIPVAAVYNVESNSLVQVKADFENKDFVLLVNRGKEKYKVKFVLDEYDNAIRLDEI